MARKVTPIKPDDIGKMRKASLPDSVLEAFNELIAMHFSGSSAVVKQDDVVDLIMVKMGLEAGERAKIFSNHWLDIEEIYESEGWKVVYDKPGYCESYPTTFTFSRRR